MEAGHSVIAAVVLTTTDLCWLVGGGIFLTAVVLWQISIEKQLPPRRVGAEVVGWFSWVPSKPDPNEGEVILRAYELGFADGKRQGIIEALETQADAIEAGLADVTFEPLRELLQGMRRANKETAAVIAEQS